MSRVLQRFKKQALSQHLLLLAPFVLLLSQTSYAQWTHSMDTAAIGAIYYAPHLTLCSTDGEKVWRSYDYGTTWIPSYYKIGGLDVQGFFQFAGKIWIAVANVGIFTSSDSGNHWDYHYLDSLQSGLAMSGYGAIGNVLIADGTTSGPLRSTDSGKSWVRIQKGLWRYYPGGHLVIGMDHPGRFLTIGDTLLGCTEHGLFRSLDSGVSWTPTDTAMFARPQTTFFYSVDTCGGYLFAATDEYGVLRSSDAGTTWIQVDSGLPAKNVQSLVSYQNMLFCGMNGQGVCLSTDYGMTWRGVSSGTNLYHVYSMVVAGAYLLAGADGHGLWRRSLSDFDLVNEERHPTTYLQLESNYPDPLTTSTIISFTLPARSFVTLSVIDCAGREAVVLAREVLDAGRHEVPWDASGFASGVYTCRLQAGGESAMGKMVVLH